MEDLASETDRRKFLLGASEFAALVPPVMTVLLSTTMSSPAIAQSGAPVTVKEEEAQEEARRLARAEARGLAREARREAKANNGGGILRTRLANRGRRQGAL